MKRCTSPVDESGQRTSRPEQGDTCDEVGTSPVRFEAESPYGAVPVVSPASSVGAARDRLTDRRYESAAHIAIVDDDRHLVGMVRIEDLLAADSDVGVSEIMDADPPVIHHGVDDEMASWKAVRHGESALAVVDDDERFLGLIPPRRMVEVLLTDHDEDLARLGGYLASTSSARHATEEPLGVRFVHRLPWLLLGLAGAVASARLVGAYEEDLQRDVLVAFFVPGIVYMADAVGTQTETLVIRGLSVGVPIRRIVGRELVTGLMVGVALALAFLPVGMLLWHRADIAAAVALSLLAACSTATVVAMMLPWVLQRLGRDPAFGSGPLATVIQDLLSLVIYFAVVQALVV